MYGGRRAALRRPTAPVPGKHRRAWAAHPAGRAPGWRPASRSGTCRRARRRGPRGPPSPDRVPQISATASSVGASPAPFPGQARNQVGERPQIRGLGQVAPGSSSAHGHAGPGSRSGHTSAINSSALTSSSSAPTGRRCRRSERGTRRPRCRASRARRLPRRCPQARPEVSFRLSMPERRFSSAPRAPRAAGSPESGRNRCMTATRARLNDQQPHPGRPTSRPRGGGGPAHVLRVPSAVDPADGHGRQTHDGPTARTVNFLSRPSTSCRPGTAQTSKTSSGNGSAPPVQRRRHHLRVQRRTPGPAQPLPRHPHTRATPRDQRRTPHLMHDSTPPSGVHPRPSCSTSIPAA